MRAWVVGDDGDLLSKITTDRRYENCVRALNRREDGGSTNGAMVVAREREAPRARRLAGAPHARAQNVITLGAIRYGAYYKRHSRDGARHELPRVTLRDDDAAILLMTLILPVDDMPILRRRCLRHFPDDDATPTFFATLIPPPPSTADCLHYHLPSLSFAFIVHHHSSFTMPRPAHHTIGHFSIFARDAFHFIFIFATLFDTD